jgi:hypothetical protein
MPEFTGKERRKSRRVPMEFSVDFSADGGRCAAKTEDVSLHGFFVSSPRVLSKGATVPFTLTHPRMRGPLKLVGHVAHIRTGADKKPVGMGVEIRGITGGQEELFDQYRLLVEEKLYG